MNNKVSIIMGIFNCENSIADSILSIRRQTYENWELIMCDDGSTDKTYNIADKFVKKDTRIRLIKNNENVGLARTLNECLKYCSGSFIMRHDADDLMVMDRIEKQVDYMNTHHCDASGAGVFLYDDNGIWGLRIPDKKPNKNSMLTDSPFIHPTVIMKHDKLLEVGGYSVNELTEHRLEDYDLWMKFYEKGYKLCNMQEPLIYYHEDKISYKRKSRRYRISEARARIQACKRLNIPYLKRILVVKPLIIMLFPKTILRKFHVIQAKQVAHKNSKYLLTINGDFCLKGMEDDYE